MKLQEGPAKVLRIYFEEGDTYKGCPLHMALIKRAAQEGMAGATCFKSFAGFGANSRPHSALTMATGESLPMVLEIVDTEANVDRFIPIVKEMVHKGLAISYDASIQAQIVWAGERLPAAGG